MTHLLRIPSAAGNAGPNAGPNVHRRGSVLVLVLVMTLSLAGLAVSAVLLTSSSSLVQRYYDKEKDFRFHAQAAVALVKSVVQRDTTLTIPQDTAYRALTASTIADAAGATIADIRVNGYAAFTADTGGTYIPFLTIMSQAYDTLGTRSVQRLDLWSEAFSRYSFFVDTFPATASIAVGQHLHGRVHGNRNWRSTTTSPGPDYYDTVTAAGTVSGTADNHGITAVSSAKRIKWPTTTTLAPLATLGTAGSLNFAPVSDNNYCLMHSGGVDLTGRLTTSTLCATSVSPLGSWVGPATRGTRVRLRPVDVNNNGTYEASEGFIEVFDLALGIDTGSIRADIPRTAPGSATNIVTMNQCGLMVTIAAGGAFATAHKEFFPVARFREQWVRQRVRGATAPTVSDADTVAMRDVAGGDNPPSATAVNKILSYGNGYSRCFPAGSPYLMPTERYVKDVAGVCTITTSTSDTPFGWGATTGACGAAQQYGGMDTTFTATVTRCFIYQMSGRCKNSQESLGGWRTFGGTSTAAPPATVIQAVEKPYLWPISTTYNAASRGVAYSSNTAPVFVSDTLRGYLTLYALGRIVLINDVVYDKDPVESGAECRNFLGLIAGTGLAIADNALNRPRPDPGSTWRFLGTPNFTLHGIAMSLTNAVGVEAASGTASSGLTCNGTNTSGGCINHTGGVITKVYAAVNIGAGTGFIENRSPDPCQQQQKNRRPPHFPLTGRYADYKAYEVDPRVSDTWPEIKTYLARLRGNSRAVP